MERGGRCMGETVAHCAAALLDMGPRPPDIRCRPIVSTMQLSRTEFERLRPVLERLVARLGPEEIWLFGSRARGCARPGSDWDLLVVLPDAATDDELDLMVAWQSVRDLRIPADVVPVRRSDFEEARNLPGTLVRTVVGEGRRIYAC